MNDLSREILQNWQVRKTKAQKSAFIDMMQSRIPGLRVEEGGMLRCRNLILGDPDSARLVLTAHYDTCAQLPVPNFCTPKNLPLYLLYNLLLVLPFLLLLLVLDWLLIGKLDLWYGGFIAPVAMFLALYWVFLGGRPNPHTANDNTSGVVALTELIGAMSPEQLSQTAFVFFDHEETGLFGSSFFASRHRKAMKKTLLVNFDCVSDGDHLLFILSPRIWKARRADFEAAYLPAEGRQIHVDSARRAFYPSDQVNFPRSVGVSALHRKWGVGLYLSRIHTPKDTVFEEENIRILTAGTLRLLERL